MMPKYLEDACEEIDAAVFSGDAMFDPLTLIEFEIYLGRWTRKLDDFRNAIIEIAKEK